MHKIRVPWLSFVFCTLLCLGYGIQAASQREEVHSGREQSRTEELGICDKCSIYILDLSELGGQPCSLEKNVAVNANNGVVYLPEHGPVDKVSHKFGTHSAPYYLYEAIRSSECYTHDMQSASLIYVYDYCYYIWWLANVHSLGREEVETPGDYLIEAWKKMMHLERWKINDGADFVFYDSHPGFVSGRAEQEFYKMTCERFTNSTHILVERPQRNWCQTYHDIKKQIITPYVPNLIDINHPYQMMRRPSIEQQKRKNLVYFSGTCSPTAQNPGKSMRHDVVLVLGGTDPDVDVTCTDGKPFTPFAEMLSAMEHSIFCIVLAGDAQSTRRLTEIFMAGCIPVFLGPPWNSMPLAEEIDWPALGIFFNITEYRSWMEEDAAWTLEGPERARWAQEAKWWIPDADISKVVIPVQRVHDIMGHLREMPISEVSMKLSLMAQERFRFTFQEKFTKRPTAVSSIVHQMCRWSRSANATHDHDQEHDSFANASHKAKQRTFQRYEGRL